MSSSLFHVVLCWLAGDAVCRPPRIAILTAAAFAACSLACAGYSTWEAIAPFHGLAQPKVLADSGDARFGVPLETRKAIFLDLATAERAARAEGHRRFPGPDLAWSAEDHRAAFERKEVARLAGAHGLNITQIYLILDQGIRNHWPGPDGEPLDATTVPLNPRRKYGW